MCCRMAQCPTVSSQVLDLTDRLYPSLPTERFEVCILNRLSPKDLDDASTHCEENLAESTQEELRVLKAPQPQESTHDSGGKGSRVCKVNLLQGSVSTGCGDVLVKAQSEARRLQEQNAALTRRGQHQSEEIARLNKALEEALDMSLSQEMSNDTQQGIWKHQAEIYKEDFQKERKDREMLKHKYVHLEEKYKRVRKELHMLRNQVTWTTASEPECHCPYARPCPDENKRTTSDNLQRRYT